MVRTYNKRDRKLLSKYFKACEFDCHGNDCNTTLIDDDLVRRLSEIRQHFNKSLVITSGYRCPAHNAAVGGARGSYHAKGQAADIVVADTTPAEVAKYAESIGILGIGLYDDFVHVDTRDWKSFWYSHRQEPRSTFGGHPVAPPEVEIYIDGYEPAGGSGAPVSPETEDKGIKRWGIDISRWQGTYDLKRAKDEGVEFVIIKGAGGDDGLYKDSQFERNYINAKKLDLPVGCYFYSKALNEEQAIKEADYFYNTCLKGKQFDLPIYIDVEDRDMLSLGRDRLTKIIKAFCSRLEAKDIWVGVYSSFSYLRNNMDDVELSRYSIWVASWTKECSYTAKKSCGMWQFGGETNLLRDNRVAGQITDQNYMLIDYPKLIKEKGKNGYKRTGPLK